MNRRFTSVRYIITVLAVVMSTGCDTSYGDVMNKALGRALGSQLRDYTWSSYPTDNFGVGTAYEAVEKSARIDDRNFICATLQCLGITQIPDDDEAKLTLAGFAAKGDGGVVSLTDKQQRELVISAMLPAVAKILNVDGKFDNKTVTTATVNFSSATMRKLDRRKMVERLEALPSTDPLKRGFRQGSLVLIVADVVANALDVGIVVDRNRSFDLETKLNGAIGNVIGKDANLSLKVSRTDNGEYHLKATNPVIVAVLPKHQPMAGVLGAPRDNDWTDWRAVKISAPRSTH